MAVVRFWESISKETCSIGAEALPNPPTVLTGREYDAGSGRSTARRDRRDCTAPGRGPSPAVRNPAPAFWVGLWLMRSCQVTPAVEPAKPTEPATPAAKTLDAQMEAGIASACRSGHYPPKRRNATHQEATVSKNCLSCKA